MKKTYKLLAVGTLLGMMLSTTTSTATAEQLSNQVYIDGIKQDQVMTVEGRTLVQLRAFDESDWIHYTYEAKTHTVIIWQVDGDRIIRLKSGSEYAEIDGEKVRLDTPIQIKEGRTYVPVRFVSETFGGTVGYDRDSKRATVRSIDAQEDFAKLMHGDLSEARDIAIRLPLIYPEETLDPRGEGFRTTYTFPRGESIRYTVMYKGLIKAVEIAQDGLAEVKWQKDTALISTQNGTQPLREIGEQPDGYENSVYFINDIMLETLFYGTVDRDGKKKALGSTEMNVEGQYKLIVPINGEKRTD